MTGNQPSTEGFSIDRFLNARRCYGPSFSRDGTRISFISDMAGIPQAWSLPAGGGWPDQITFFPDRVGLVEYSPTDQQVLVATDVGGNENIQIWRIRYPGANPEPLTHDLSAMHPFGGWSPNGRLVAFTSNERDRASLDVVVLDVETGTSRTVLETDGMYAVEAWSPESDRLIVSRVDSSANNDLFEIDLQTRVTHLLTEHRGSARFEQAVYRVDGQALYLLTDLGRDFLGISELNLANHQLRTIHDTNWDIETFGLSPNGRFIALCANVDGYSRPSVLDLKTNAIQPVTIPDGVVARSFVGNWNDRIRWSSDGRRLAFSLVGARETQNIWLADPSDGAAWQLTHSTVAGIRSSSMVEPELVHYRTFDGRSIPAYLYCPAQSLTTGAAVVYIHGGPESQSRPAFDPLLQYLVDRGYTILVPNVRGSTGYGNAYSHLDDVERRMDAVADANAGAQWLASSGHAHSNRIAAMGGSYGGFMVLASLTTYPETWAAGVDLYGISNFVTFFENTHPFRRKHRAAEYGSLEHHRPLLERISPITHVERIRAPLFVAHGEEDIRVPIGETEQLVAALRARQVPVEFVRLAGEGHGIVRMESKLAVYPAIAAFLDRHLLNAQPPGS